jgi:AcrR family transcriptional regulator
VPPTSATASRPRVTGMREQQILDATIAVLIDVGYDRLTMDAVAATARASKATLYRRWTTKTNLVIDALIARNPEPDVPDTGSLRTDLLTLAGATGWFCHPEAAAVIGSVVTAVGHDREFADAFRSRMLAPKLTIVHSVFTRAAMRGDVRPDLDIDMIAPVIPAIVIHRMLILGQPVDEDFLTAMVDQLILPATHHPVPDNPPSHQTVSTTPLKGTR